MEQRRKSRRGDGQGHGWGRVWGCGWGHQHIIKARWNEKHLPNFRMIAQKQIPPFVGVDPAGLGWEWAPKNKIVSGKPTVRSNFCLLAPAQFSKHIPLLVGWTLRALGWSEPPKNKILLSKPTPSSIFCLLAPTQLFTLRGIWDGVTMGCTLGG